MSLDVYLIVHDQDGNPIEAYSSNITHNLGRMAESAGIYEACWQPEERGWQYARDITPALEQGLADLKARPEYFQQFNAPNGWGLYEHFVPWVERYLAACRQYPSAAVSVWR